MFSDVWSEFVGLQKDEPKGATVKITNFNANGITTKNDQPTLNCDFAFEERLKNCDILNITETHLTWKTVTTPGCFCLNNPRQARYGNQHLASGGVLSIISNNLLKFIDVKQCECPNEGILVCISPGVYQTQDQDFQVMR